MRFRKALPLTFALAVFGCANAPLPKPATAAVIAPDAQPPAAAVKQTDVSAAPTVLHPLFTADLPHGWTRVAQHHGFLIARDLRHDSILNVYPATATHASAADECRAAMEKLTAGRDDITVGPVRTDEAGRADQSFSFKTPRGMRDGEVTVRHFGRDGRISVSFAGSWMRKNVKSAKAEYENFIRDFTLVEE